MESRLHSARKEAGLSLADVSRITGLSSAIISKIENGLVANPGIHTIYKLCMTYGVPVETVMGGEVTAGDRFAAWMESCNLIDSEENWQLIQPVLEGIAPLLSKE